eukprot:876353-Ditylum_brightwellii.AAC.1
MATVLLKKTIVLLTMAAVLLKKVIVLSTMTTVLSGKTILLLIQKKSVSLKIKESKESKDLVN